MEAFKDRADAGSKLAVKLKSYKLSRHALIVALPRGGVPVAFEVAKELRLPLDILIVRKLGVPGHSEFAMGAIASGGVTYLNEEVIRQLLISPQAIDTVLRREQEELYRREEAYRGGRPGLSLENQQVILVDDGLATGSSMLAAIESAREQGAKEIVVAVPVIAQDSISDIQSKADGLVYVLSPERFYAVGNWYQDFRQTTDKEVEDLLFQSDFNLLQQSQGA